MSGCEEGECLWGHDVSDRHSQTDKGEGKQTEEGRHDQKYGTRTEKKNAEKIITNYT